MARNVLEIVLQAIDKASGPLGKVSKATDELGKSSKKSGTDMKALGATALKVTGTIAAFGFAAKKAFDLAKEGAVIKQTGQSFGFLMAKVGASADTLDQLRAASKGTISDMDLMSSTATLLAGAQGELGVQMAKATPQLMSIAKAAQKLNPSLGDTTFLYNSLALGIKRGSPLILDNLGLLVSVGDANKKLAAALGKTVAELTSEEQKLALLNETMRAGNVLVEQAGGTTDSATDSYTQLTAAVGNLTDAFKMQAHDGLEPAVGALAHMAAGLNDIVQLNVIATTAVEQGIVTQKESIQVLYDYRQGLIDLDAVMKLLTTGLDGNVVAQRELQQGMYGGRQASMAMSEGIEEVTETVDTASLHALQLKVAAGEMSQEMLEATMKADAMEKAFLELGSESGHTADEVQAAKGAVDELAAAFVVAEPAAVGFAANLRDITDSADRAMMKLGNLLPVVVDVENAELSAATVASEWAKMKDLAALAAGELTQEIIDEKVELDRLTIQVENAKFKDEALMAQWIESFNRLAELTDGLTANTGGLRDNTAAKEANRLATERANEITDAYRIMTGAATVDTIALEKQIRAATEAFKKQGEASGFSAEEIANMSFTLLGMNDILREQTRITRSNVTALHGMTEAAKRSWLELSKLGTVMPGMRGGAPPGEFEGPGGAERFAQEQGWQVSAKGRTQEKHAKQVLGQIVAEQSGVWESGGDMSGWVKEFMMSGAGTGLAAGFDESVVNAAIQDLEIQKANAAQGLSGIVPGGFPNDSFLIGATSGERVNITPAHMRGGGGGMVINNVNVYGVQTSSQLFEAVTQAARQRGRDFAKVM